MNTFRAFVETLKKRRKLYIRLSMLLVVNGVLFATVTYRLANKQERLARDHERLSFELAQKKTELEQLSSDEARVSANAGAVTGFWADVVKTRVPGLTEAWEEIDRLANESNVVKGRTSYARELMDVGLEQIKATMPVEGTYFDLARFINRLERSERFFLVEEVRLSQRATEAESILLACSISFFLKAGNKPVQGAGS